MRQENQHQYPIIKINDKLTDKKKIKLKKDTFISVEMQRTVIKLIT